MKVFPDYYPLFKCIGGACRHNCCIGWEIDIDEDTLALYETVDGPLGERLKNCISHKDTPHFILSAGERCPFLNEHNLCDIITCLGEEALCDICAVHPRFVNETEGRTELGLGLCCEAAGELFLSRTEMPRLLPATAPRTPLTDEREVLFTILFDRSLPLWERLERLSEHYGLSYTFDPIRTAERYLALEHLEKQWPERLARLRLPLDPAPFARYMQARETEYEQLAAYLLYRHFLNFAPTAVIRFVCEAVHLIFALGAAQFEQNGAFSFADQVELCRLFSAEIEYSDENLNLLLYGGSHEI